MEAIDSKQLWRQVPPEEKFELMARSHSKGMAAALGAIIVGGTLAVGLQIEWMLWASILLSPVIFQGTASKSWRHLKPQVILEYLAARSAARRFAFSLNSNRLTIASMIRGNLEEVYEVQSREEELEADFQNKRSKEVWIALFHDALIIISEQSGGAKLEIGQLLNKYLQVSGNSPSGQGEYANDREILIKISNPAGFEHSFRLTSRYPAALIVLEKQMGRLLAEALDMKELPAIVAEVAEEPEDFLSFGLRGN